MGLLCKLRQNLLERVNNNINNFIILNSMQKYFKVPDQQARRVALGSLPGLPYRVKKSLQQIIPLFDPVKKPKQGDWLWDHEQQGQSYDAYKGQMHNQVDGKRNIDPQFVKKLKKYCQCFFHPMKVQTLKQSDILQGVDRRINDYTQKEQFNAKHILLKLQKCLKPDAFCLIGIAITDLYPRDQWNFVFGLASIRERTGVFSFARYDPRFFEVQDYRPDYEEIFWRAAGVMTHETCHMFGMRHCIYYDCLMNGSNNDQQAASKPLDLCVVCLRKLQSNIKFDILERFEKMKGFIDSKQVKTPKKLLDYLQIVIPKVSAVLK